MKKLMGFICALACIQHFYANELHTAITNNDLQKLKKALYFASKSRTLQNIINEEDICGYTPLTLAITYNKIEMVKVLLLYNANIDKKTQSGFSLYYTPIELSLSLESSNKQIIELLLEAGANITSSAFKFCDIYIYDILIILKGIQDFFLRQKSFKNCLEIRIFHDFENHIPIPPSILNPILSLIISDKMLFEFYNDIITDKSIPMNSSAYGAD